MEIASYYATKTLLNSGITSLPVTQSAIEKIILEYGYDIIPYSLPLSDRLARYFSECNVLDYAENYPAFTKIYFNKRFVAYRLDYSMQERLSLLAHELGHIAMNHRPTSLSAAMHKAPDFLTDAQEFEADSFAVNFLAPPCILKTCGVRNVRDIEHLTSLDRTSAELVLGLITSHSVMTEDEHKLCIKLKKYIKETRNALIKSRRNMILFILLLLALVASITSRISNHTSKTFITPQSTPTALIQTAPTQPSSFDNTTVEVLPSGKKYHKKGCHILKGKNSTSMSLEQARNLNYEPCQFCCKEEQNGSK